MPELGDDHVYVGRGCPDRGIPPSPWANPYRVRELGRAEAVRRYGELLGRSPQLLSRLRSLSGKTLVCHCRPDEPCHADQIIAAFTGEVHQAQPGERAPKRGRPSGSPGPVLGGGPRPLAERLAAAKHARWVGDTELTQLQWTSPVRGLVVVIDLWSGHGGTILSLLAIGRPLRSGLGRAR